MFLTPQATIRKQNGNCARNSYKRIEEEEHNEKYIIRNFSLQVKANEKIGIVGRIGCGKSSILKTLVRLQCFHKGKIFLGGRDMSTISTDQLRECVKYVGQTPKLFDRTLLENITLGKPTTKDPIQILRDAGLSEVANAFEPRLNKPVGKYGSNLSGGQCQIVCLLRLALDPGNVVILDEPTSAMDERSRDQIMKLVMFLTKNSTMFLITHDKTLLKYVDRVVTIHDGQLIQDQRSR
jgi:ATP-binding cassette subfamily C protein LapB